MTEEENEKLKAQLKVAGERIDTLSSTNIALSNQIEYYKKGVAEILNSDDSEIGELRKLLGIVYVDENELNQLRELKNQIEKMKCCGNCKHHLFWNTELHCELPQECIRYVCYAKCREDKWELAE